MSTAAAGSGARRTSSCALSSICQIRDRVPADMAAPTAAERTITRAPPISRTFTQWTPDDLDAAVQGEREACADVAYGIYDDRMTVGEEETAQGAYDAAVSIQARGPTPALAAALAQARRETWARAAEIAERVAIPEDCHGVEAHGRLMAAHAAADAIRSAAAGEEGK